MRNQWLSTRVILSGAKDLTPVSLITLRKQRDTSSVGEVPHFVRDDLRLARSPLSLMSSQ
jgi:hypothetical protein